MHYPIPVERLPTLWSFWLPLSLLLCRSIPLWPRTVTSRLVWGAMERRKKWRGSRRDEEAMHEGREAWENSMGAQDGSRVEDLVFKVFCVCVSDQYAQKGGYTFLCECGFCVRAYFCVFVFVCVHVCFHVCRVVCEWGRALKERSTAGGHSWFHHPSARLKLPQKLLLFSQRLSASFPCSLSFLMSFSPSFSSHCVFSAFSSISPFSSRQGSPSLPLPSLISGFTPLLPSSAPGLVWLYLQSPSFFLWRSTLVHALPFSFCLHFFSIILLPLFSPSVCKVMLEHEVHLLNRNI